MQVHDLPVAHYMLFPARSMPKRAIGWIQSGDEDVEPDPATWTARPPAGANEMKCLGPCARRPRS